MNYFKHPLCNSYINDPGNRRPLLTAREARQKISNRKTRKQERKALRWAKDKAPMKRLHLK